MNKVTGIVGVAVVAAAAYFGLQATGMIGGNGGDGGAMALAAFADEINNADGGMSLHRTVRLDSASVDGTVITIIGTNLSTADASADLKMLSSESQVTKYVCANEALKAAMAAGATLSMTFSAENGEVLGTKQRSGEKVCP